MQGRVFRNFRFSMRRQKNDEITYTPVSDHKERRTTTEGPKQQKQQKSTVLLAIQGAAEKPVYWGLSRSL